MGPENVKPSTDMESSQMLSGSIPPTLPSQIFIDKGLQTWVQILKPQDMLGNKPPGESAKTKSPRLRWSRAKQMYVFSILKEEMLVIGGDCRWPLPKSFPGKGFKGKTWIQRKNWPCKIREKSLAGPVLRQEGLVWRDKKRPVFCRAKGMLYRDQREGEGVLFWGLVFILSARGSLRGFQKEQNKIWFACFFPPVFWDKISYSPHWSRTFYVTEVVLQQLIL